MATSDEPAFGKLYEDGFLRAVVYAQLPDGSVTYTIGKKSDMVSGFPVGPETKPQTLLYALNQKEAGWGGGTTIGGAPRNQDGSRSRLSPDKVFEIINDVLRNPVMPAI